jgi:hypothetical protein
MRGTSPNTDGPNSRQRKRLAGVDSDRYAMVNMEQLVLGLLWTKISFDHGLEAPTHTKIAPVAVSTQSAAWCAGV